MNNALKVAGFNFNKLDSPEDLKLLQLTGRQALESRGINCESIIFN